MITSEQLGQTLRDRRKLAKITQQDLSDLAGLAVHTISDLESGKGNPTLEVLSKLCAVLGLEIQIVPRQPGLDSAEEEHSDS